MTDESLESIIRRINNGEAVGPPYRVISDNVGRGLVCIPKPDGSSGVFKRDMFFVFSERECVGLVYVSDVLNENLHAYTLPEHRRKGHMHQAFKNVVLPELARDCDEHHVSVSSEGGARLLNSLGEDVAVGDYVWINLKKWARQH